MELDDTLAEAHSSLGMILSHYDWNREAAEKEFKRALELGPNSAAVHRAYAWYLLPVGRRDEALLEIRRAQELDPLSSIINRVVVRTHTEKREFDRAIEESEKILKRDPTFYLSYLDIGVAFGGKGLYRDSVAALQRARELSGGDPQVLGALAYVHATHGSRDEALKLIAELDKMSTRRYVSPVNKVFFYAALGDKEKAFEWLDRATAEHNLHLSIIPGDYRVATLVSDPRFDALLKKIGGRR